MNFPVMYRAEQEFVTEGISDVPAAVRAAFAGFKPERDIRPGQSVALGVASRGTHDLKDLVKTSVECLKEMGLKPFIIPAMGSHGGATAPGQIEVLNNLGITEELTGVPIKASMEVVSLGRIANGSEVLVAKDAFSADHLMVINRVKPHTGFRADVESGLCKIMAVGLGRQKGAVNVHRFNLADTVVPSALRIMEKAPLLCGLAVTENALGQTHSLRLTPPSRLVETDAEFLTEAWKIMPLLPFDSLDLLIIDEMGKDVSGTGMDPNVIGFWRRMNSGPRVPDYRYVAVLDLTEASHGNATGMGMADLIPERIRAKIDYHATYMNCRTSGVYLVGKTPMVLPTDRELLEVAFGNLPDPAHARVVRIVNTSRLKTFWLSQSCCESLGQSQKVAVDPKTLGFKFDSEGGLLPFTAIDG